MAMTVATKGGSPPPRLRGALPVIGHLHQLRRDPIGLMKRVVEQCGPVGEFRIGSKRVVLLSGEDAQEAFFRAPDEQLDQGAAYPFMTPVFGRGVVFDAPVENRSAALGNTALRDNQMRGHAQTITREVDRMVAGWDGSGQIDLLDFFAELMIYTSSACLIGRPFREELGPEFTRLYHTLERGTDPIAYMNPYLPLPSFRARDRARVRMVELVEAIIAERDAAADPDREQDLLDVLISLRTDADEPRYSADEITGMFIAMMFAGHHTTSGTAAWTLIELLRHPDAMTAVQAELDELFADGRDVSYQALREIPLLEAAIKEALRLHPPLILLMRMVTEDLDYEGHTIEAGKLVGASPAISNRMPGSFPDPDSFDLHRYVDPCHEDRQLFAWIPFGAGRHRCVGAAFAMMQLKAVLSSLLLRYRFEMRQPPDTYRNDHSKMVVQLQQPCVIGYAERAPAGTDARTAGTTGAGESAGGRPAHDHATGTGSLTAAGNETTASEPGADRRSGDVPGLCISVDRDLCQGHSVCCSEAPAVFEMGPDRKVRVLHERPPAEQHAAVRQAVRHCPTGALSIGEDGTPRQTQPDPAPPSQGEP
jgi:sterol 14-demethylase